MPQSAMLKKLKLNVFLKSTRLLELTHKKAVLFIIRDWNGKIASQEIPGVTGRFGLGVQNEAGQRLIEFFQENALVIVNTHTHRERTAVRSINYLI